MSHATAPRGHKRKAEETLQPPSKTAKRQALLTTRQKLPIWPQRSSLCAKLQKSNILLLVGETGSGKSTQLPQFLLDQPWCSHAVAVTQPRRVAAISLAQRVADEMGSTLGRQSPASRVGYSVRFDQNVGKGTRVKYLTDGMLVNEMLADPWLREYSCVVVDEAHERSVNCDLILGFLVRMLGDAEGMRRERGGRALKVVVMSATLDSGGLREFLERRLAGSADRSPELVKDTDLEDESEWSGFESDAGDEGAINGHKASSPVVTTEHVPGRQYPVTTSYLAQPADDVYTTAVDHIIAFHTKEPLPGDILVFLTGQEDVESVCALLAEKAATLPPQVPKLLILPLYAALGPAQQQAVFQPTPKGTRKVIVSTNIAESSVTIPGIRIVVDNGLVKVKEHRSQLGLDSLLVKSISKSAAIQRKGRAGREGTFEISKQLL